MAVLRRLAILVIVATAAIGGAVGADVYRDQQQVCVLTEATSIFEDAVAGPITPSDRVVARTEAGQRLPVLRVRYWKDGCSVRVALANGETGWLNSGGGGAWHLEPK